MSKPKISMSNIKPVRQISRSITENGLATRNVKLLKLLKASPPHQNGSPTSLFGLTYKCF